MIYPTRRAVILMAVGAPLGVGLGLVSPELWRLGGGWMAFVVVLILLDAVLAPSGGRLELDLDTPGTLSIGREAQAAVTARFDGRYPRVAEAAVETGEKLRLDVDRRREAVTDGVLSVAFIATPQRRGEGLFERLWLRWTGPLGLVWRQKMRVLDRSVPILPDIPGVRQEAVRLFSRDALHGVKVQRDTGEGAEFHALRDFQLGMDRRSIDWKQSARHSSLLAKEFRTERNHQIFFALDTGRVMSEPAGDAPRIDRAINGALFLAFVSLKMGDRVGLFAFDSKVRASSGAVSNVRGFAALQRVAAGLDYSTEETNFTLGLTTLGGILARRSLVVVFTDFADTVGAELMIENLGLLLKRHLVLFVVMRDEELEGLVRAEPVEAADVSRAVTAAAFLRERDLVLNRLRHMGVLVLETEAERVGPELVSAYVELKRRGRL